MKNLKGYFVLLVLAAVLGGGIFWKARANETLRREEARLRSQLDEIARLKAGNTRFQTARLADEELKRLTQVSMEASELRERIQRFKEAEGKVARQPQSNPAERWRNVGLATPANTLGSVVWAATGGEVDLLASMLAYDSESKAAADELFASIPEESRKLFPSAEKLIATFISGRLPADLVNVQPTKTTYESAGYIQSTFKLQRASKAAEGPREVTFLFQRFGSDWKLVVPQSVILDFKRSLGSN